MTLREIIRRWLLITPSSPSSQENLESTDSVSLVYTVLKDALEFQQAQKNSLETKASALIAFAGGMFALLIGARETVILLSRTSQILILVSLFLFAVSVILANVVTWVRRYRADPNPEVLAKTYLGLSPQEIRLQLISNLISAWKSNYALLERNAIYLRLTFVIQAAAFILLGIALFLSVV